MSGIRIPLTFALPPATASTAQALVVRPGSIGVGMPCTFVIH